MKKSAGFTLIELVIVIVILGILGAVAAPRFINMQGDAYEANVKALNGSIQSAMTLANTKAILDGYDNEDTTTEHTVNGTALNFVHGFPTASLTGIVKMLQDTESFNGTNYTTKEITAANDIAQTLIISPSARTIVDTLGKETEASKCQVEYTQASKTGNVITPAKVKAFTKGC